MTTRNALLFLPFLGLLTQCSSKSSASAPLPTLSSPALAKEWGAPKRAQTAEGYVMTYTNPVNGKEKVTITGSRELMFFLYYPPNLKGNNIINGVATAVSEPQLWKKSLVAGQTVKWYHAYLPTADRGGVFKTLGTELKDNFANRGSYRIVVEGTKKQMQSWLSALRFDS